MGNFGDFPKELLLMSKKVQRIFESCCYYSFTRKVQPGSQSRGVLKIALELGYSFTTEELLAVVKEHSEGSH